MFYLFLDTCVLLDISTKKQDLPLVSALEELVAAGMAWHGKISCNRSSR
ncbi:hypothetical protein Sbal183_1127 [Shewanella baltica OS183]|nr:hypothetical protein Sbal183_1127 [Shewanella baltica OS183]